MQSGIDHLAQSLKVTTSVNNFYTDLCPRCQGFECVDMASKNTEVAGSPFNRSFRLHIGQFDVGLEGITTCTVALKLHLSHHPRSLPVFGKYLVPQAFDSLAYSNPP